MVGWSDRDGMCKEEKNAFWCCRAVDLCAWWEEWESGSLDRYRPRTPAYYQITSSIDSKDLSHGDENQPQHFAWLRRQLFRWDSVLDSNRHIQPFPRCKPMTFIAFRYMVHAHNQKQPIMWGIAAPFPLQRYRYPSWWRVKSGDFNQRKKRWAWWKSSLHKTPLFTN